MLTTDAAPTLYDVVNLYGENLGESLATYPIWDEAKREWLNGRIYNHFAYRQIAQDTPALFLFYLERRMNDMMLTLNPIFKVLDGEVDILSSYSTSDLEDATTGSDTQSQSDNVRTGTTEQKQLYSATPQTQLSGNENYATNLTEAEGNDTATTTDKSSVHTGGDSHADATHEGRSYPVGDMLANWVAGVNNALYLVYNGLEPLFQQVWDE